MNEQEANAFAEKFIKQFEQLHSALENRHEELERLVATLLTGYAEMAANMQAVMSFVSEIDPENSAKLKQKIIEAREKLFETLGPDTFNDETPTV